MAQFSGRERRRHLRLEASFTVIYKVDRPLVVRMQIGNKEVYAVMLDLSESGMAIVTHYNIPGSTILSMKFTLVNEKLPKRKQFKTMAITGEVRYGARVKKECRLGIRFMKINEADKRSIAHFVEMVAMDKSRRGG